MPVRIFKVKAAVGSMFRNFERFGLVALLVSLNGIDRVVIMETNQTEMENIQISEHTPTCYPS